MRTRLDISAVDSVRTKVTHCRGEYVPQQRMISLGQGTLSKTMRINKLLLAPRCHLGHKEKEGRIFRRETTLVGLIL